MAASAQHSRSSGSPAGRRTKASRSRLPRGRPRAAWPMPSARGKFPQATRQGGDVTDRPLPELRSGYRHFRVISTRWMDNDVYGHINNVQHYSFFDTVVNGFLIAQGVLDPHASPVIGLVVETKCNYFESLAFPDEVHAGLRVARIGGSSVRYEIGLFRGEAVHAAAQGHFVHVYVDRATRRPAALPDGLRRALTPLVME